MAGLRDIVSAHRQSGTLAVIAEVKARSSSGEDLLRGRDPVTVARAYADAGTAAISVVTGRWFGGDDGMLRAVADADLGLPLLRKDFIRSRRDLERSIELGASAVLLTRKILAPKAFAALLEAARELSLDAFVEVADADQVADVLAAHDGLVAINNADITTREMTGEGVGRSLALRERFGDAAALWVSASRLEGPQDIAELRRSGFDAALVGTHLLRAADPGVALAAMVDAAGGPGDR